MYTRGQEQTDVLTYMAESRKASDSCTCTRVHVYIGQPPMVGQTEGSVQHLPHLILSPLEHHSKVLNVDVVGPITIYVVDICDW